MRPVIGHRYLNFSEVLSNDNEQRIEERTHGEIERQIWNEAVHNIKTNKMGFQILLSLFQYIWLSLSDGYLLMNETNTRVKYRS